MSWSGTWRAVRSARAEREQLRAMKILADAHPVMEPPANLVARSRLRLEEALDALPPKRWYERLTQRMMNNFASLQAAPVAACLLLVVGAGAGSLGGYEFAQNRAGGTAAAASCAGAERQLRRRHRRRARRRRLPTFPASCASRTARWLKCSYNQVVPQHMEGSLDDPAIRQLLMLASRRTRLRRGCGTTRWGCWRTSARPGTVARRRAFAMR